MARAIQIHSLTPAGSQLGTQLVRKLKAANSDANVMHIANAKPFATTLQQAFREQNALVLICATGIAVRTIAPVLENKKSEPPVIVIDEHAQYVIPLLSGHEGGANQLAKDIAQLLDAHLVITTANSYLEPTYTIGMGCERGCSAEHLKQLFYNVLDMAHLSVSDITSINSIDIKADEVGLIELANELNMPFNTFDKQQLNTVDHLLSTRSDYVFKTVGVYGVAESAALFALKAAVNLDNISNNEPELVQTKIKTPKATCAIARRYLDSRSTTQESI